MPVWNEHDHPDGPPTAHDAIPIPSVPASWAFEPPEPVPLVPHQEPAQSQSDALSASIRAAFRRLDGEAVPNPPWQIGPCIQQGDCAYIVGEGGAGKSTFIADVLTTIADPTREAALAGAWRVNRELVPEDPRICIVNAETSLESAWQVHLMRANAAAGHSPNSAADRAIRSAFRFLDKDDLPFSHASLRTDMETLARVLIEDGFNFVCIDPIYALFAPGSPGDDDWVTVGMKTLLSRLKAAGITTFALAHPPETSGKSYKTTLKPYGSSQ